MNKAAKQRCEADVHDLFGVGFHQCFRRGVLLHGTKFYCKQHHPPTITAYEAERDARWRKKWANQDAALERQIRIADATAKVIEAAKAWRAFDPGIDYEVEDNLLAAVDALLEAEK